MKDVPSTTTWRRQAIAAVAVSATLFFSPSTHGLASASQRAGATSADAGNVEISGRRRRRVVSVVTGANGYVGREVVNALLRVGGGGGGEEQCRDGSDDDQILCLVRPHRVEAETRHWEESWPDRAVRGDGRIRVLPYDMSDGGRSIADALATAAKASLPAGNDDDDVVATDLCVYHVASVFGPSEDHVRTALDNVQGTKDLVRAIGDLQTREGVSSNGGVACRLVLTSSMAAVRGSGQVPANGEYYTHEDWNTLSKLDDNNWGSSYQWSKAESERSAWEMATEMGIPMTSICPSFVFGPPASGDLSGSYSLTLVGQWLRGESPVQSRLCVDIRDVAAAHVAAGRRQEAAGERFIVSTEARVSSAAMAEGLAAVCRETGLGDPQAVSYDSHFQGGAIPIGSREVEATDRLERLLGISLRPVDET